MTTRSGVDWARLRLRLAQTEAALDAPVVDPATRSQILHARARNIARAPVAYDDAERVEVVEFLMSYERYAVEITCVREVLALRYLTPLPGTPGFVAGIVNVHGRIVSVVDLKAFFDLPDKGLPDLNRVLVVSDGHIEFGLLVDSITGLRQVSLAELQPALPTMSGLRSEYLRGLTPDRLAVLDAARITSDPNLIVRNERS